MAEPLVLMIETGKHKGKQLRLPDGNSTIGRDKSASIRIASAEVSREHASLTVSDGKILVKDLGSSNGTYVNGSPIQGETLLKPGDLLLVGPMGFRVHDRTSYARQMSKVAKAKSSPSEKLSDDDIAVWLSDDSAVMDQISAGDTAVIPAADAPKTADPIPPPSKKVFHSVAEEAQDIIRRHNEMLAAAESDDDE